VNVNKEKLFVIFYITSLLLSIYLNFFFLSLSSSRRRILYYTIKIICGSFVETRCSTHITRIQQIFNIQYMQFAKRSCHWIKKSLSKLEIH